MFVTDDIHVPEFVSDVPEHLLRGLPDGERTLLIGQSVERQYRRWMCERLVTVLKSQNQLYDMLAASRSSQSRLKEMFDAYRNRVLGICIAVSAIVSLASAILGFLFK